MVRVKFHLSNGIELGPTEPKDLEPGKTMKVSLAAMDEEFETWGAHPEVGSEESGEHEGDSEHNVGEKHS